MASNLTISQNQSKIKQLANYLITIAATAEGHVLNAGKQHFDLLGQTPLTDQWNAAKDICASAEEVCNRILEHMADMTGQTATTVDWSSSKMSLWQPLTNTVSVQINRILSDFNNAFTNAPDDLPIRTDIQESFENFYGQVFDILNEGIGPHFPTLFTTQFPRLKDNAAASKYPVRFRLVEETSPNALVIYAGTSGALPLRWEPFDSSDAFDDIVAGDKVFIEFIDSNVFNPALKDFEGFVYEVFSVAGLPNFEIRLTTQVEAPLDDEFTPVSEEFNEYFRMRKVEAA